MKYAFHHERLDCYQLAVEVNRFIAQASFPPGRSHLRDQGLRASDSVVLNLARSALASPRPDHWFHLTLWDGAHFVR